MDLMEHQELVDLREHQELTDRQEHLDLTEVQEPRGFRELKEHKELLLDLRDLLELQVKPDPLEHQELMGLVVLVIL